MALTPEMRETIIEKLAQTDVKNDMSNKDNKIIHCWLYYYEPYKTLPDHELMALVLGAKDEDE